MKSRPETLIEQPIPGRPGKLRRITKAAAYYAVYYDGQPFSLTEVDLTKNVGGEKYKKTVFPTPGYALLLARKLNYYFGTDKFQVFALMLDGSMEVQER